MGRKMHGLLRRSSYNRYATTIVQMCAFREKPIIKKSAAGQAGSAEFRKAYLSRRDEAAPPAVNNVKSHQGI
jgi:hypothetical protein